MSRRVIAFISLLEVGLFVPSSARAKAEMGRVEITVVDKATGKPVPCRVHLKDANGKGLKAENLPFWNDHFVCRGDVALDVAPGKYTVEIEHGPEYSIFTDSFMLAAGQMKKLSVELQRLVDMTAKGWWPGDTHVHRPVEDMELLLRAEDLHVAPVITWWNKRNRWATEKLPEEPLVRFDGNRFYHTMAGEDERDGGALLFFHLKRPLDITEATREFPSPLKFAEQARKHQGVWIEAEKPFWWDVPVWVAAGQVDSLGIANNHMCRDKMYETEAWGKPRLVERYPSPLGNGYWTQDIYYRLLNCGLRIPPSAGSASGVLPNPVGYNRVYVHVGKELTWEKWWEGLRAGRSFVTNGPMLLVTANGEMPGQIFTAAPGQAVEVELKGELTTRDPVRFLEIIRDGEVERRVSVEDFARTGSLGTLTFKTSGWFLVRAVAENPRTFRFASTAPFYVEVGDAKRRVSKSAAKFFLEWVKERAERIKLDDAQQREEVLKHHTAAEKFWKELMERSNAE
jgi:hypothetical protein